MEKFDGVFQAGDRVRWRDGNDTVVEATLLTYRSADTPDPLFYIDGPGERVGASRRYFTARGSYCPQGPVVLELLRRTATIAHVIERWVDVYPDGGTGKVCDSQEEAQRTALNAPGRQIVKLSGEYKIEEILYEK